MRPVSAPKSWYWQLFSKKTKILLYRFHRLYIIYVILKKWIHSCSRCYRVPPPVSHPHPKSVNSILSIASWSIAIYCFPIGGILKLRTHALVILEKFHKNSMKIEDCLIISYLWAFGEPPSSVYVVYGCSQTKLLGVPLTPMKFAYFNAQKRYLRNF